MQLRDARALSEFVAIVERLEIAYCVGGSIASSYYGDARSTTDIDLVLDLSREMVHSLVDALTATFYVDREFAVDAVARKSSFQALHLGTYTKLDLFIARDDELTRAEFETCVNQLLFEGSDRLIRVASPEVIVLRKLDWIRRGNLVSEQQWRDILGVLKTQQSRLDFGYMREHADKTGLSYPLKRAFEDAGLSAN